MLLVDMSCTQAFIFLSYDSQIMSPIKKDLFVEVAESVSSPVNKVTVVGVGQVGMACAFSILAQVSA